jgi:hypothetical protein
MLYFFRGYYHLNQQSWNLATATNIVLVRKPLFWGFVIPDACGERCRTTIRNPGFRADFGNWIPAFAGMTLKPGLF